MTKPDELETAEGSDIWKMNIQETRPSGRRPLSAAVESGHYQIARLLLERGADPNWGEPSAPKGRALHSAARAGEFWLVETLLKYGADPNSGIDSSGNALFAAATPEIKNLLRSQVHCQTRMTSVGWKTPAQTLASFLKAPSR